MTRNSLAAMVVAVIGMLFVACGSGQQVIDRSAPSEAPLVTSTSEPEATSAPQVTETDTDAPTADPSSTATATLPPVTQGEPTEPLLVELTPAAQMVDGDRAVVHDMHGALGGFPATAAGHVWSTFANSETPAVWRLDQASVATSATELPFGRRETSGSAGGVAVFDGRQIVTGAALFRDRLRPVVWERRSPTAAWTRDVVAQRSSDAWMGAPRAGSEALAVVRTHVLPGQFAADGSEAVEESLWILPRSGDWFEARLPTYDPDTDTIGAFALEGNNVVVAVQRGDGDATVVMLSTNAGVSFEEGEPIEAAGDGEIWTTSLFRFGDVWLMGGSEGSTDASYAPTLRASSDGVRWEALPVSIEPDIPSERPMGFADLTRVNDAIVATIGDADEQVVVVSDDAVSWRLYSPLVQARLSSFAGPSALAAIAVDGADVLLAPEGEPVGRWNGTEYTSVEFEPSAQATERVLRDVAFGANGFRVLSALDSNWSFQLFEPIGIGVWGSEPEVEQFGVNWMIETDNGLFFSGVEPVVVDGVESGVGTFQLQGASNRTFDGTEFERRGVLRASWATAVGERWFVAASHLVEGSNNHYVVTIGPDGAENYWTDELNRQDLVPVGVCPVSDEGLVPVLMSAEPGGEALSEAAVELWSEASGYQGAGELADETWANIRLTGCAKTDGVYLLSGTQCGFEPVPDAGLAGPDDDGCRAVVFVSSDGREWTRHAQSGAFAVPPTTGVYASVAIEGGALLLAPPHGNKGQTTLWFVSADELRQVALGGDPQEFISLRDGASGDGRVLFVTQDNRILATDLDNIVG